MGRSRKSFFCGSAEHDMSRRNFLGSSVAAAGIGSSVGAFRSDLMAEQLKRNDKRVILLWLAGGASQMETWDPQRRRGDQWPISKNSNEYPGRRDFRIAAKDGRTLEGYCNHPLAEYRHR